MNQPDPEVTVVPRTDWTVLPPEDPGVCQTCAVKHEPELPHNPQSMHYQIWFITEHDREPTWTDAMAHCTPQVRQQWTAELAKHGVLLP